MTFEQDCESSLETVERLASVFNEPTPTDIEPLTWGAFARECSIKFGAIEQMAHYALSCEDLEGRVRVYVRLNELCSEFRQLARDVEAQVSADIAEAGGKLTVEGLGEVQARNAASSYSWDIPGLVSVLVARAMDERDMVANEDGDLLPYPVIGQNVADRLAECVSFGYGRIGACKEHGVNASKYRTAGGERRRTLQLPRVDR